MIQIVFRPDELKRLDALLEYAIAHGETEDAIHSESRN